MEKSAQLSPSKKETFLFRLALAFAASMLPCVRARTCQTRSYGKPRLNRCARNPPPSLGQHAQHRGLLPVPLPRCDLEFPDSLDGLMSDWGLEMFLKGTGGHRLFLHVAFNFCRTLSWTCLTSRRGVASQKWLVVDILNERLVPISMPTSS